MESCWPFFYHKCFVLICLLLLLLLLQDKPSEEECGKFGKLWKEFGRALKLGIVEDNNNRWRGGAGGHGVSL